MGPTFSPDSETALIEGTVCMRSPLENRFQKTSLGKDQAPYLPCENPEEGQLQGARDHKKMPEGKTAIWESLRKDRDRRQATPKPFQVVLNLLLTTAIEESCFLLRGNSPYLWQWIRRKVPFFLSSI